MTLIVDVVIVGSGVLGCAAAYALTESGHRRVAIVDRGPLVSGMTRRNAGLVHTHLRDVTLVQLAQQSLETYRHWATLIGGTCGFMETGTLVTAGSEAAAQVLRERVQAQRDLGIEARTLEGRELSSLCPSASFKDVVLAALEPASGYVDAVLATQGFARRARDKGAKMETGTLVKAIGQERGQITHVVTTTGNIQTQTVIVAAGAGAERLLMPLGFSLGLESTRGLIGFFEQPLNLREGHPTFVEAETLSFLRPHAFHLSAAGIVDTSSRGLSAEGLDEALSDDETRALTTFAARRLPQLHDAPLRRAHAILYDHLSDGRPALGAVPGFDGLFVVAGLGENAVATAPAVGRALAELVIDGRSSTDISGFQPGRPSLNHSAPAQR